MCLNEGMFELRFARDAYQQALGIVAESLHNGDRIEDFDGNIATVFKTNDKAFFYGIIHEKSGKVSVADISTNFYAVDICKVNGEKV